MRIHSAPRTAAVLALLLGACAEERAPVNRVQPNAYPKSFFVNADNPEFYMRTTVVDAPYGAPDGLYTASDAQGLARVRFEITEKLLLARLTYELIKDSDHHGARRVPNGQVVAAYAVEKHFDIRRDYNPGTGEETNVTVENDTDRPWYQREHMRVNWSRNLVTDAYELDTLSQAGIWYGVEYSPVEWFVNDPASPDAPVFDKDSGYFDTTYKVLASPQVVHDPDWGDIPACYFYGRWPVLNCNPSEITLRQSFRRVVDTDYEPVDWDGERMDMFGMFTSDRQGYDRRYGVVDDKWHRFAARWNLWKQSHVHTAPCAVDPVAGVDHHRDRNGDGTEDECASVGRGSRCDEFRQECTIPLRDREVRTIPWHVNRDAPPDLFEGAAAALHGWSEALRTAVVAGRLAECRRTKEAGCEAAMGWPAHWSDDFVPPSGSASPAQVPDVFVLCHNPVQPADDAACGSRGLAVRYGDLRFNMLAIWPDPQQDSPWGIMVDADDPLTGEKIAGSANEWAAVLDGAASSLADLLGLLNGEIKEDEFIAGKSVAQWVSDNRPGGKAERVEAMSAAEQEQRFDAFEPASLRGLLAGMPKAREGVPAKLTAQERARALSRRMPGPGNEALLAKMQSLRGSALEARMIPPGMRAGSALDPSAAPGTAALRRISPFGLQNPAFRRQFDRKAALARVARHACRVDEPAPDHLLGLAREAKRLFPSPDPDDAAAVNAHRQKVWNWARDRYSRSVLSHELGHSMGLRHNFAGSFDALNYPRQYWQLRTRNGTVTTACAAGTQDGSDCVGPRWNDPPSDAELEGNIGRFTLSSVMDYPGDQNGDMNLDGPYDRAAVRFAYGNTVDVWDGDGLSVVVGQAQRKTAWQLTAFATSPGLFGVYYFPRLPSDANPDESDFFHYSQYQKLFGLLGSCTNPQAGLDAKCDGHAMDVVDLRDLQDFISDPAYAAYSWAITPKARDAKGRVRRGYLFSSDEYADSGNVPSFTNDAGADPYEQVRFLESAYENRYVLDAFRRNRVMFNSLDYAERIQARYFDAIQQIAKTFAFAAVMYTAPTAPSAQFRKEGYFGPLNLSATVALDMFARVLTRPDPGAYCDTELESCPLYNPWGVDDTIWQVDSAPIGTDYGFHLPLGAGRYIFDDFDYTKGYYWSDYQSQAGSYWEKIWATWYLAEAFDTFISNSKEDFTDGRYKNLNFATVFPNQVRRLYGALFTGDAGTYSPWAKTTGTGPIPAATPVYPPWSARNMSVAPPADAMRIDPDWAWNEQLYAMVFGALFFPTDWSNAWVDMARIAVTGADQIQWPAAETYAFRNPATGLVYRAHSTGTETVLGKTRQKSIGARMLEWANHLTELAYKVERHPDGTAKYALDHTLILSLDADGHPQLDADNEGADIILAGYVENVDLMRELTSTFFRDAPGQIEQP